MLNNKLIKCIIYFLELFMFLTCISESGHIGQNLGGEGEWEGSGAEGWFLVQCFMLAAPVRHPTDDRE